MKMVVVCIVTDVLSVLTKSSRCHGPYANSSACLGESGWMLTKCRSCDSKQLLSIHTDTQSWDWHFNVPCHLHSVDSAQIVLWLGQSGWWRKCTVTSVLLQPVTHVTSKSVHKLQCCSNLLNNQMAFFPSCLCQVSLANDGNCCLF